MDEAVRDAIADHHRVGNPVAIWRDGQVTMWYPDGTYRPVDESAEERVVSGAVTDDSSPQGPRPKAQHLIAAAGQD